MELLLYIAPIILVFGAQLIVSGTYSKYKTVPNSKGITGYDVARIILDKNGLENVEIFEANGVLADYYDPRKKTVNLSKDVYYDTTIASVAIAAHECGHAIQHKEKYNPMMVRSAIIPAVNLISKIGYLAIIIGIVASFFKVALIGIVLLLLALFVQLITLPVEFNASGRAIRMISNEQFITTEEGSGVKTMLTAAAFTYVASLIASLLEIFRLFLIARDND